MAKITYTNKVALNVNPEVAAINKVQDTDMNEIKSVVNTNDDNVGDLTTLTTTTKTSVVAAINEVNSSVGLTVHDSYSQSTTEPYSANYVNGLIDIIYPVGSIYLSVSNTNPSTLFGGTWEQIQDRFLLSAGSTYTAGDTGGEATHTLTDLEMPSHNHRLINGYSGGTWSGGNYGQVANTGTTGEKHVFYDNDTSRTTSAGGGQAHNNMPPYLVVYMWKRTA